MKTKSSPHKSIAPGKTPQLKTELPISEKDEVKKAEDLTNKATKKNL